MGIGAYLLAGALQGAGNGIAQQGAADIAERREQALQTLRAQQTKDEAVFKAGLDDEADARKQKRANFYGIQKVQAQGDVQAEADQRRFGYNIKIENVRQSNRLALEGVQHNYRLDESATEFARQADKDAAAARDQIDRWDVDAEGNMVGFTKLGKIYHSKVKLQRKDPNDDAIVPGARPGAPTPAATPTPAAPKVAFDAPRTPEAVGAPGSPTDPNSDMVDPEWLAKYGAGGSADPLNSVARKSYTMDDLKHTAKANNLTVAEARRKLDALGYVMIK